MTVAIPPLLRGMPRVLPFLQIYARSIGVSVAGMSDVV
jgi:hypothetical protein